MSNVWYLKVVIDSTHEIICHINFSSTFQNLHNFSYFFLQLLTKSVPLFLSVGLSDFGNYQNYIIHNNKVIFSMYGITLKIMVMLQNVRENPQAYIQKPNHSKRVTVRSRFCYRCITWPSGYRAMLNNFLVHKNWKESYLQRLFWTWRCYMPLSRRGTRFSKNLYNIYTLVIKKIKRYITLTI